MGDLMHESETPPKPIVYFTKFAGWLYRANGKAAMVEGVGVHHTLGTDPGEILTSTVVHVEYDEDMQPIAFETRNSRYQLLLTKDGTHG